jgi:hypothetical protein
MVYCIDLGFTYSYTVVRQLTATCNATITQPSTQQSRNLATQQSRNLATQQSRNLATQQSDHATLQRNNHVTLQRNNHATLQHRNFSVLFVPCIHDFGTIFDICDQATVTILKYNKPISRYERVAFLTLSTLGREL